MKKKLNWFKTSNRHIVIDYDKCLLKNETVHGRVRKQFPFDQISVVEESAEAPTVAIIKFIADDLVEDGLVVAEGGQRNYKLTFESQIIRDQFVRCLELPLSSSVQYQNGILSFTVYKRLNMLQFARRTLVLDIVGKVMYNIDKESRGANKKKKGTQLFKQAEAERALESKDVGDVRKKFAFSDIVKIEDDARYLNKLIIHFRGGQRPYNVEFSSPDHRKTFHKVMDPFVTKPIVNSTLKLRVIYTHPQSTTNTFQHAVHVTKTIPTTDGGKAQWTSKDVIEVPPQPDWYSRQWDISRGMTSRSLQGVRTSDMHSTLCARHAKLCLVAYTMEAARRSAKMGDMHSVSFHVLDPGLMNTPYYNKAIGLGGMVSKCDGICLCACMRLEYSL